MSYGGPELHCPKCKRLNSCRSIKLNEPALKGARSLYYTNHKDIQWYRRRRRCGECEQSFLTAEVDERFLGELLALRNRLMERRQARIAAAMPQWVRDPETIPKELAQEFIRHSCWWMTHSSGKPVRARGFAERIRFDSHHGWVNDFGANAFLVGTALRRSAAEFRKFLDDLDKGKKLQIPRLRERLRLAISGAVANASGNEYAGYYPINGNDLVFGAHVIDLDHAVDFLLEVLDAQGLDRDLKNMGD